MAKVQRTTNIPEDIHRLFKMREQRSGVTYARQVTAALLSYFFDRPTGPDPIWIEAATAIDNGTLSIIDAPAFVAHKRSERVKLLSAKAGMNTMTAEGDVLSRKEMAERANLYDVHAQSWEVMKSFGEDPDIKLDTIGQFDERFRGHQALIDSKLHGPDPEDETEAKNK